MLTTYFISPHPLLQDFVDTYFLSTSENNIITFDGYWPATNESNLVFYMGDPPQHDNAYCSESELSHKKNYLIGLLTRSNGYARFTGRLHTFVIQFKANGINKIFRLPMNQFTDKIYTTEDVFGNSVKDLHEQLRESATIQQMTRHANTFLLAFLNHHKKTGLLHDGITAVSREIYTTANLRSVEQYAHKANMSVRNFERRFIEQAGVSAKLYTKLVRFNEVMKVKMMQPVKNWTSIAYECGYYDQMHLIKDFKQFTDFTPTEFFRLSEYPLVDTSESGYSNSQRAKDDVAVEKFIFVKRTSF